MSAVLITYASKMGSTKEIAERIGAAITQSGDEVTIVPAHEVRDVTPYDAVVLGSALYAMRWRPEAVRFLKRHQAALAGRAVWLFHSGPCGPDAGKAQNAPAKVRRLASAIGADGPITFGGRLSPDTAQGFLAKRMAQGPLAGDYRDWDRITEWATTITSELHPEREGST